MSRRSGDVSAVARCAEVEAAEEDLYSIAYLFDTTCESNGLRALKREAGACCGPARARLGPTP